MAIKRSFFERLSGDSSNGNSFDPFDDDLPTTNFPTKKDAHLLSSKNPSSSLLLDEDPTESAGELPVDVHQTDSDIIIRAFVAGVRPDELNISISRDMVEIGGSRAQREQISGPNYFTRELFWGTFARTILLPQEIDVEASSASAKDGLLTIIMPKLDKARQTKLRVKAG